MFYGKDFGWRSIKQFIEEIPKRFVFAIQDGRRFCKHLHLSNEKIQINFKLRSNKVGEYQLNKIILFLERDIGVQLR